MYGLSKRQKEVLDAIAAFQKENGWSPSYADILLRTELKSKSEVWRIVRILEVRGRIRRLPGQPRSIEVIRADQGTTQG